MILMPALRPTTVPDYIAAAPPAGQKHLRRMRAILRKAAPKAQECIKWNQPFYVEPRFLFAFTAYKAHLSFAPVLSAMKKFEKELVELSTTKNTIKIPYDEPFPDDLVRAIAEYCVRSVSEREDDAFWEPGSEQG